VTVSPGARAEALRMLIASGRRVRLAVRGASMLPSLREPMVVTVGPAPQVRIGDILVFAAGPIVVVHRAVGRLPHAVLTSGDAQPDVVEHVAPCDVIGRVEAVWSTDGPGARRVDGLAHRVRGVLYALLRRARVRRRRRAAARLLAAGPERTS